MNLPYSEKLDIQHFSRLFDNMSECYKLFWFQAIVDEVVVGKETATFETIIDSMIADAWYMVSEYRLNLGPNDTLEGLVHYAFSISGLKSNEKKENILNYLKNSNDPELIRQKRILTLNVPYRLQAPFMPLFKGNDWNAGTKELALRINQHDRLMYYFEAIQGLQSTLRFSPEWCAYICENQEIVRGWIRYNLINYLQRRNPSVPGVASKIDPPEARNLEKVKKLWKAIVVTRPVHDIYGDILLAPNDLSIDHFVPWSYVAHDELWNLSPTTKSINSSKSNSLPEWDLYFEKLGIIEFNAYETICRYDEIRDIFEKCASDHINDPGIKQKLYCPGLDRETFSNRLKEIVEPVYRAAEKMGFGQWRFTA